MNLPVAQQNQVSEFNFNGRNLTVILVNDEPFFNANEVAEVLEYSNPRQAVANHVDLDDVTKLDTIDSLGRTQSANFLNESGLYALTFGSKKESAKTFKKWVTSEVLPSIRKTGSYHTNNVVTLPNFTDPAEAAIAWAKEYKEKQALQIENAELKPKADALDVISVASNSLCIRETAKTLGIQQNKFISWCINHDWLYRDSKAKLCPISHRVQNGFLEQRAVPYNKPNGEVGVSTQAMFTGKALTHLAKTFAIIKEVA